MHNILLYIIWIEHRRWGAIHNYLVNNIFYLLELHGFRFANYEKWLFFKGDDDRPARGGRNDFSRDTGRAPSGRVGSFCVFALDLKFQRA